MNLKFELQTKPSQTVQISIKISRFLEKNEKAFWKLIQEVENNPVFLKIYNAPAGHKAIKINPRKISPVNAIPNAAAEISRPIDLERVLEKERWILNKIKKIGREKFIRCFTRHDLSGPEISKLTNLSLDDVNYFRKTVLDKVHIAEEFEKRAGAPSAGFLYCQKVAFVDENLRIQYLQDKKRYEINQFKLLALCKKGFISSREMKIFSGLKQIMNLINLKINIVKKIVHLAVKAQAKFLKTGCKDKLRPLEAKKTALKLKIHPSWLCRILKNKYIVNRGKTIPLKSLFVTSKKLRRQKGINILEKTLNSSKKRPTDHQLQKILKKRHGITVSRRTVNLWKNILTSRGFKPNK